MGLAILVVVNTIILLKIWQSNSRDLEQEHKEFLRSLDGESLIIGPDGDVSFATTSFRDALGVSVSPIGESLADLIPLGDQIMEIAYNDGATDGDSPELLVDGGSVQSSLQRPPLLRSHPMGVEFVCEIEDEQKHFILESGGVDPTSYDNRYILFEDITETRQSEVRLRSIIEHASDFVSVVCSEGTVRSFKSATFENEDACCISRGDNLHKVVHPDDRVKFADSIETAVSESEPCDIHVRMNFSTGKWILFDLSIRPSDPAMCGNGAIIIGDDISDELQLEQRRQVLSRVLRHNLRNDMNVICGHAQLLLDSDLKSDNLHSETIYSKANSLMDLAEKVRDIDLQLYGADRQIRRVNLSNIVEDEVEQLHREHPNVDFRLCVGDETIIANSLVRIAIKNLLENSIEHNDTSSPKIRVSVEHEPSKHRVCLEISDDGPGIPKGESQPISDGVESKLDHVSGVGLWLVKWIIDGVDGSIDISENEPRGTTVSIGFPSAKSDHHVEVLADSLPPKSSLEQQMRSSMGGDPIGTSTRS